MKSTSQSVFKVLAVLCAALLIAFSRSYAATESAPSKPSSLAPSPASPSVTTAAPGTPTITPITPTPTPTVTPSPTPAPTLTLANGAAYTAEQVNQMIGQLEAQIQELTNERNQCAGQVVELGAALQRIQKQQAAPPAK
jgi:hypothetical protein